MLFYIIVSVLVSLPINAFGQSADLIASETKEIKSTAQTVSQDVRIFSGVVNFKKFELVPSLRNEKSLKVQRFEINTGENYQEEKLNRLSKFQLDAVYQNQDEKGYEQNSFDNVESLSSELIENVSDTWAYLEDEEPDSQTEFGIAYSPFESAPVSFYAGYKNGIESSDKNEIIRSPKLLEITEMDFYQFGTSYDSSRFSADFRVFLSDRFSREPFVSTDEPSELFENSRSYGVKFGGSAQVTKNLSVNGSLKHSPKSYIRNTASPEMDDSAPNTIAVGGMVLNDVRDFNFSLGFRYISGYRFEDELKSIKLGGHNAVNFAMSKRLKKWVDFNFSVENFFDKKYSEIENLSDLGTLPNLTISEKNRVTPRHSTTINFGLTFRFGAKE